MLRFYNEEYPNSALGYQSPEQFEKEQKLKCRGKIFGANATVSAILDRFLENVHLFKVSGKSYRLKNLKSKEEKMVDSKT